MSNPVIEHEIIRSICGKKYSYIYVPALAPLIPTPLNLVLYSVILAICYYAFTDSFVNGTNIGPKSLGTAAAWAFLFYYIFNVILNFFIFKSLCKVYR